MLKSVKPRSYYFIFACAGVAILLCLLMPYLRRNEKFPYTGKWMGQYKNSKGTTNVIAVEFTKEDNCFVTVQYATGVSEKWRYTYQMAGNSAVLSRKASNLKIEGRPMFVIFTEKVTPLENGTTIRFQSVKSTYIDEQTNKVWKAYTFSEPDLELTRVK